MVNMTIKFHKTQKPNRMVIDYDRYTIAYPYTGEDFIKIPISIESWTVELAGYRSNMQGGDKVYCTVMDGPIAGYTVYMAGDEFVNVLKLGMFDSSTGILSFRGRMKKHGTHWRLRPEMADSPKVLKGWYIAQCAELAGLLKLISEDDLVLRPRVQTQLNGLKKRLATMGD